MIKCYLSCWKSIHSIFDHMSKLSLRPSGLNEVDIRIFVTCDHFINRIICYYVLYDENATPDFVVY